MVTFSDYQCRLRKLKADWRDAGLLFVKFYMPRLIFLLTLLVVGISYLCLSFFADESPGSPNEMHALAGINRARG
jgi:hypothetical protein